MSADVDAAYHEILGIVRSWPAAARFDFVHDILRSLEPDRVSPEERRAAFRRLEGILATDAPPPTDEEVQQILEEELLKKYS